MTAVFTGVLVGLIAGLLLDRRARQREQSRYRFLRREAVKAVCAAVHRLSAMNPIKHHDARHIELAENALGTFTGEVSTWRNVLLDLDEDVFLRRCSDYANHFSTAITITKDPESFRLDPETLQHAALDRLDEDLDYFDNEELRIDNDEVQHAVVNAERAIRHAQRRRTPRRGRASERVMARTAEKAAAARAEAAARLGAEQREELLTRIYSESDPTFRRLLLVLAERPDPTEPITYAEVAAAQTDLASPRSVAEAVAVFDYRSIEQYGLYCPFGRVADGRVADEGLTMDAEVARFLVELHGERDLPVSG